VVTVTPVQTHVPIVDSKTDSYVTIVTIVATEATVSWYVMTETTVVCSVDDQNETVVSTVTTV